MMSVIRTCSYYCRRAATISSSSSRRDAVVVVVARSRSDVVAAASAAVTASAATASTATATYGKTKTAAAAAAGTAGTVAGTGNTAAARTMKKRQQQQRQERALFSSSRSATTTTTTTTKDRSHRDRFPVTAFTEDETMIRDAARDWSRTALLPAVRDMDAAGALRADIVTDLFRHGFMGMEIPEQFAGTAANFTAACLVVEEIARVDPSVAIMVDIHNTLTNNAVQFWGSEALRAKWLPRLATDCVSSFCLSEAGSGSDAFSMKTTATAAADQSYYTLQGTKLWISNAEQAGVFLVFANADPSAGYKGITAFMVDAATPGVTVGKPESKLGLKASSTCPVTFDEVKVDAADVLGDVGQGYKYCINILNEGRIGIAAQQIGIAKGCLDVAMPYIAEREQFGTAIANFQAVEHSVAAAATEIYAAECMTYNAARLKEAGQPFVKEASMCKYYAAVTAERVASKTIEWLGGVGFTTDMLAEKFYRDCKVGSIYEGTTNIQLQTIAKLLKQEYGVSRSSSSGSSSVK